MPDGDSIDTTEYGGSLQRVGPTEFQLLVVFILILLSALASATETALLSLGQADIHAILKVEKRRSRMLAWWDEDPNRVLTAILITNNLINILASSLATGITQDYLHRMGVDASIGLGVAVAVGVMTFMIVMFGEVVPKTFARNNPRSMLPFLPLMWLLCKLFSMPALALQRASSRFIRAVGGSVDNREKVTEAQIDSLIRIGAEQGSLAGETGDLLSSVMEFSETRSMEIMVPRTDVVAFEVNDSLQEVLRVMNEQKYSRYPVYEEDLDTILGILTTKDVLEFLSKGPEGKFSVREMAMRHKAMIFPEVIKIGALLKDMQKERVQMAFAFDEFGGMAGIVTVEDIVEEIVGEIWDEHEKAEEPVKSSADGSWIVKGRAAVEELAEETGIEIPDQDLYETVGGMVMTLAGKVPLKGDRVSFAGFEFEVLDRTRTRVICLSVRKVPDTGQDPDEQD